MDANLNGVRNVLFRYVATQKAKADWHVIEFLLGLGVRVEPGLYEMLDKLKFSLPTSTAELIGQQLTLSEVARHVQSLIKRGKKH